jgi:hypothetical protein
MVRVINEAETVKCIILEMKRKERLCFSHKLQFSVLDYVIGTRKLGHVIRYICLWLYSPFGPWLLIRFF